MNRTFESVFDKLAKLPGDELDRSAHRLVMAEKRHVADLICHLAEIAARKAHLEWGFANLFEYCVKRLGLSEGSVALRIQVAGVARRMPQVLCALAENCISLTVAGRLAPHLTEDNAARLLSDCAGMTRREVEEYLVPLAPRPVCQPGVRRSPSRGAVRGQSPPCTGPQPPDVDGHRDPEAPTLALEEAGEHFLPASERGEDSPRHKPRHGHLQPAQPDVYNFRFAAGREFKHNLERLAEVLGVQDPVRDMAMILERAVDIALEKKDPGRRHRRRFERQRRAEERGAKRGAAAAAPACPDEVPATAETRPMTQQRTDCGPDPVAAQGDGTGSERPTPGGKQTVTSRHVPIEVRERVLERAGHRCEYRSTQGKRCTCRTGLQIEHTRAFAIFRSHDEQHLRAYCRRHNLLRAEQVFGAGFVRRKIRERRQKGSSTES